MYTQIGNRQYINTCQHSTECYHVKCKCPSCLFFVPICARGNANLQEKLDDLRKSWILSDTQKMEREKMCDDFPGIMPLPCVSPSSLDTLMRWT